MQTSSCNQSSSEAFILVQARSSHHWIVVGAAPRILRLGVQNKIRERSERKKIFVPPLFQMWGTSKQISVGACWIYWNLLSDFRINKHRQAYWATWTAFLLLHEHVGIRFEQCSSPVGWTVETRPKPSFQISLTWQVSTRVRGVETWNWVTCTLLNKDCLL